MFHPAVPFKDLKLQIRGAYDVVMAMTEDQLRYAMWCTLTLLFGSPTSNAPKELAESEPKTDEALVAVTCLAQVAVPKSMPQTVKKFQQQAKWLGVTDNTGVTNANPES